MYKASWRKWELVLACISLSQKDIGMFQVAQISGLCKLRNKAAPKHNTNKRASQAESRTKSAPPLK